MTESAAGQASWEDFVHSVAAAAGIPVREVSPSTRLIEDLDLDSLALTEVVVMLIVELGMESLSDGLEQRRWDSVTVGGLYDEYISKPQAELRRERVRFARS